MRVWALMLGGDVYGRRIVENLCRRGFAHWLQGLHEFKSPPPADLLDNPEEHLPESVPECDLILSLGLPPDLQHILPILAKRAKAKAVIAPIDDPSWIPPGLRRQIEEELAKTGVASAFPKPFCSLEKVGDRHIEAFADRFGCPKLKIRVGGGVIREVRVERGAPCGSTWFIAEKLVGVEVSRQRVQDETARAHHAYPCLASMKVDPELGDTILHESQYLIRGAVEEALKQASSSLYSDRHKTINKILI